MLALSHIVEGTVTTISYGIRDGGGIADSLDPANIQDGGVYWARYVSFTLPTEFDPSFLLGFRSRFLDYHHYHHSQCCFWHHFGQL